MQGSLSIPRLIDKLLDTYSAPALVVPSLVCSFLLCLFSTAAHCGHLIDPITNKQIGFLFAPNWVIVYMVLFPLYLYCFSAIASLRQNMIADFVENDVITGPGGKPVNTETVELAWKNWHKSSGTVYGILLAGVIASSGYQWYTETYEPFATGLSPDSAPDWGSFFYHPAKVPYATVGIFVFSTVCYIYMAFALFVFLGLLLYSATIGSFLRNVSFRKGELRLIYHNTDVSRHFNAFLRHTFLVVFLGLCAAYAMRLQSSYLTSDYTRFDLFMFSEYNPPGLGHAPAAPPNYSWGTALGVAAYTLILGGITGGMVWGASANSRSYYLTHIGDPEWRKAANLAYDQSLFDLIEMQRFWTIIIRKYSRMVAAVIVICIAIVVPFLGTLFLVAVILSLLAILTGDDDPERTTLRRTEADRPIRLGSENREKLERLLHAHISQNGGGSFIQGIVNQAKIPKPYKDNILTNVQAAADPVKAFLESALQQGTVHRAEATVIGFLLIALIPTFGVDQGCVLCKIMTQSKLLIEITLSDRLQGETCGKLTDLRRIEWEADLNFEDRSKLTDILAKQASYSQDARLYFDDMIRDAQLPEKFKQLGIGRFWGPPATSNFIGWALNQGRNPLKPEQYTIASLLVTRLDSLGLDDATWLVALLISNKWVGETEGKTLQLRFYIPELGSNKSEVVAIGPDFAWQAGEVQVHLQGILRPDPVGLDVGFITGAAMAARTVCRIEDERGSPLGTGFLIRPDVLVTCFHLFGQNEAEVRTRSPLARLRFGQTSTATLGGGSVVVSLAGSTIITLSDAETADFVLIRIKGTDAIGASVSTTSSATYRAGDNINILHHPRGVAMQLNISPSGVTWRDDRRLQYLCNTAVGSSGAPCYDDAWNIVAIHHALRSRAFGISGEGIPISWILTALGTST